MDEYNQILEGTGLVLENITEQINNGEKKILITKSYISMGHFLCIYYFGDSYPHPDDYCHLVINNGGSSGYDREYNEKLLNDLTKEEIDNKYGFRTFVEAIHKLKYVKENMFKISYHDLLLKE